MAISLGMITFGVDETRICGDNGLLDTTLLENGGD